jgi:hypothetical protein
MGHRSVGQELHRQVRRTKLDARSEAENKKRLARLAELEENKYQKQQRESRVH